MHDELAEIRRHVRSFIGRRVANPADADDLAQEAMLRLIEQLQHGRAPSQPMAWLFRVARNVIADHHRRSHRQHRYESPISADAAELSTFDAPVPDSPSPDAAELAGCLERFVNRLPEIYREPVRRVDLLGQDRQTVAGELG